MLWYTLQYQIIFKDQKLFKYVATSFNLRLYLPIRRTYNIIQYLYNTQQDCFLFENLIGDTNNEALSFPKSIDPISEVIWQKQQNQSQQEEQQINQMVDSNCIIEKEDKEHDLIIYIAIKTQVKIKSTPHHFLQHPKFSFLLLIPDQSLEIRVVAFLNSNLYQINTFYKLSTFVEQGFRLCTNNMWIADDPKFFQWFVNKLKQEKDTNNIDKTNYSNQKLAKQLLMILITILYWMTKIFILIQIHLQTKSQFIQIKQIFSTRMGYTHYWRFYKLPTPEAIQKVLAEIPIIREVTKNIKIQKDQNDPSPPLFTDKMILFNGPKSDGHQPFYVDFEKIELGGFNFCKTARKQYDEVVCLVLLSMANHIDGFEVRSDGSIDREWKYWIDTYENEFGKLDLSKESFKKLKS